MKTFDVLYARDSAGRINEWKIRVNPDSKGAYIQISEGLIGGKKTESERSVFKGKNIGKMNETTPFEQACNDAQSRWEKKKKQGYKSLEDLNIDIKNSQQKFEYNNEIFNIELLEDCIDKVLPQNRTDENNLSKPMKAQPYFDDKGNVRIKFPCYGQPKLNGFRVFARLEKIMEGEGIFAQEVIKPTFRSKEGLRYTVLEHIESEIEPIINNISSILSIPTKDIALDGEMYIHGEILSEISSAVRKRNNKTSKLKFYIFDIAVENVKQDVRLDVLSYVSSQLMFAYVSTIGVFRYTINSNEEAQTFTDECIKQGYEGAIFRDMKAVYQFGKRPKTMVKLKRTQDKEFKIVDVVGGENSPELGIFVCVAENGKTFKVTPEGSHEIKKEYLSNKTNYIGKMLTVKFYERTKDDLPFHAVGVTVRDYE